MQKIGVGPAASAQESGALNIGRLLDLATRLGGWVTADLAARWIWPTTKNAAKMAERLIRRAVERELLLPRRLAGRRHAYAVTRAGAAFLGEGMLDIPTGTGWGRVLGGEWFPPAGFAHDERAARLLVSFAARGMEVLFGHELARANPSVRKLPDGLARVAGKTWGWIEVENARKSGPAMRHLAEEIVAVEGRRGPWLQLSEAVTDRAQPGWALLVLPPEDRPDDRGYRLSHRQRIESAVQRQHPVQPVKLRFFIEARPWVWTRVETIIEDQP